MNPKAKLTQNISKSLLDGHPWVYADAVELKEKVKNGTIVDLFDEENNFVGRGPFENGSPLSLRLWTTREGIAVDEALLWKRLGDAKNARDRYFDDQTTGYRLCNGEGDRVPGIVIDVYANTGVIRVDGRAAERWIDSTKDFLVQVCQMENIVVRRSEKYRDKHAKAECVLGEVSKPITFLENGIKFLCDPIEGQKTGFFLDQRANRSEISKWAKNKNLLNLFGYTGGFSLVSALRTQATTTTVDLAKPAIAMAQDNFRINNLDLNNHEFVAMDVEKYLEKFYRRQSPFDVIICDPPSYVKRRKDVNKGKKAYVRLFAKVLDIAPLGGVVALASCSSHINRKLFREIVNEASRLSKSPIKIHSFTGPDVDHPYLPGFAEFDYLQFMVVSITN